MSTFDCLGQKKTDKSNFLFGNPVPPYVQDIIPPVDTYISNSNHLFLATIDPYRDNGEAFSSSGYPLHVKVFKSSLKYNFP